MSLVIGQDNLSSLKGGKIIFYDHSGNPLSFDVKVKSQRLRQEKTLLGMEFVGISPKEKLYLRASLQSDMETIPVQL